MPQDPNGVEATEAHSEAAQEKESEALYYLLGSELLQGNGQWSEAFDWMLQSARLTDDDRLYERAARLAMAMRSGDKAEQAIRAWVQARPHSTRAGRYWLAVLVELNRARDVSQALQQWLRNVSAADRPAVLVQLEGLLSGRTLSPELAQALSSGLQTFALTQTESPAARAHALRILARLSALRKDYAQSQLALEQALSLETAGEGNKQSWLLLISLFGRSPERVEALLQKHFRGIADPELRLRYAQELRTLGRSDAAALQLQQLLKEHPQHAPSWLRSGLEWSEMQRGVEAQANLNQYLELDDASDEAMVGRAMALSTLALWAQKEGRSAQARSLIERIGLREKQIELLVTQSAQAIARDRIDEGRRWMELLPANDPKQLLERYMLQAQVLREAKQYSIAQQVLQEALTASPRNTEILTEIALLAERQGLYEEMEQTLRQVMRIKPDDAQAYNSLGYTLADRNVRLDEARVLIEKALELAPDEAHIQDSMGWLEFRAGRMEQARAWLEKAFRNKPHAEVAAHLGEVLWIQGEKSLALQYWRAGLRLKPDDAALLETLSRFGVRP